MRVEQIGRPRWDDALPAGAFDAFHTADALDVLDRHCEGTLRRYGIFDDELVGVLPVFERDHSLGRATVSPPPGFGVPWLGTLLAEAARTRESTNEDAARAVIEAVGADTPLTQFWMRCPPAYRDPRPFDRSGLAIRPSFAYRIDYEERSLADLRASLSSGRQRHLRTGASADVTVRSEGLDGTRECYRAATSEGADGPSWSFVRDLVETLGERARTYVARENGTFLGGSVVLYAGTAACTWLSGTSADAPEWTRTVLDWHVLRDAATDPPGRSIRTHTLPSLPGAPRRPEPQFGADLAPYYEIESPGRYVDVTPADRQLTH